MAFQVTVNSSHFHPAHQHYTDEAHKAEMGTVCSYIYIYIYIPNMYLESYMSRVLDIPKYRANKDKDKINLVYFIRLYIYIYIRAANKYLT
jgi:hypothetical protein